MILDARHFLSKQQIEADVCIIGGGVAGIVLARELQSSFEKIVILESGEESFKQKNQDLYSARTIKTHYFNSEKSRLRMLGGSSNHWENNTAEFLPSDFEKKNWIENSGWPIQYDDINKYYIDAADYCGTGRDGYAPSHWTANLPGKDDFSKSEKIKLGFSKHASPPTRFFFKFKKELIASNVINIIQSANVTALKFRESDKKIESATFKRLYGEHEHEVKAKVFILATGGIENARLLLHFNSQNNNALGNRYNNVGAYFMDHPTLRPAQFYPKQNFKLTGLESKDSHRSIYNFYKLSDEIVEKHKLSNMKISFFEASKSFLSHSISSMHILKEGYDKATIPDDFFDHIGNIIGDLDTLYDAFTHKSGSHRKDDFGGYFVHVMMEQTPDRNNRILLSDETDALGIPKVDINWTFNDKDVSSMWKGLEILANEVGLLEIGRIRLLKERSPRLLASQMGFGHHHMGTTRMSDNVKTGVVDSNQKVFGTNNMFIAGSSVFPTGSHVPPTLTIVATSLRLAKYIVENTNHE